MSAYFSDSLLIIMRQDSMVLGRLPAATTREHLVWFTVTYVELFPGKIEFISESRNEHGEILFDTSSQPLDQSYCFPSYLLKTNRDLAQNYDFLEIKPISMLASWNEPKLASVCDLQIKTPSWSDQNI